MPMNITFPHAYECEQLDEIPSHLSVEHYYYPSASKQGGRDGIIVEVRPAQGLPWLGTFAFGQITPKGSSGVFTTPNVERLCVVSRGEGYFVSTIAPGSWERVALTPIIEVHPIQAQEIIVFAEFTRLVAYGRTGLKWKTKRLTWDSLKIIEVTDTFIKGEFWDIHREVTENFTVDLTTGVHEGGIREL